MKPSENTCIVFDSLFYKNKKVKLSGYYGYDAQWFPINKKWIFRLVLFDLNENVPVGELICENEDPETIKKFISDCIVRINGLPL